MSILLTDDTDEVVGIGFDLDEMDEFYNVMMGSVCIRGTGSIYDGIEFAGHQVRRMFTEGSE